MANVRTRIAPSPTGFAHIGTIYQVLFDFCFAKKHNGQFVVRIEDTDRTRFIEGAEEVIHKALEWFSLEPDESPIKGGPYGPYRSSERLDIYQKYAGELIEKGFAYYCFCAKERLEEMRTDQQKKGMAAKYDKLCLKFSKEEIEKKLSNGEPKVIRLNVPTGEKIKFHDEIAGDIEFESDLIDDQVLIKSDGFPTYHLAVVVDDYLMKISHIFRGTEWIPSAPKHILLYRYLGWEDQLPFFVHLPLILNSEGQGKLSKRQQAAAVEFYRQEGYLPEAILNYLSNIVWNHPEGKEIYSRDEFIKLFEISDLQNKGARFDLQKLDWMNGEYIRAMSDEELTKRLQEFLVDHPAKDKILDVVPLIKERIKKLSDFVSLTNFFWQKPEYDKSVFEKLLPRHSERSEESNFIQKTLDRIIEVLKSLEKPWKKEEFEARLQDLAKELVISNRDFFQLLRVAISGQLVSPPLFESMQILGEDESIQRIEYITKNYQSIPDLQETIKSE